VRRSQSEHLSEQTSDTLTPGESSPDNNNRQEDAEDKNEGELGEIQDDPEMHDILHTQSKEEKRDIHDSDAAQHPERREVYQEGDDIIIENEDGDVVAEKVTSRESRQKRSEEEVEHHPSTYYNLRKKLGVWRHRDDDEESKMKGGKGLAKKRGPALAYQFGNTVSEI